MKSHETEDRNAKGGCLAYASGWYPAIGCPHQSEASARLPAKQSFAEVRSQAELGSERS
jgi:hypothetical protein